MKITLIRGGLSAEREVSLRTGAAIEKALLELSHTVNVLDPKIDGYGALVTNRPDVAFVALHGKGGEDGSVQGLLQSLKIPFTGSGVLCSALCYDKILTKLYLKQFGVVTPEFFFLSHDTSIGDFLKDNSFMFPLIVKPSREGSTFGVTIVKDLNGLAVAIGEAKKYCPDILIERFIAGGEMTVGILNGKALPVVEIAPKTGFFDYESKYTPGKTEYFAPARIDAALSDTLKKISELVYKKLGCRGAPRADFMIDAKTNQPYFLEINTVPGMTETSLLPKAARCVGIEFNQLCAEILRSAALDA